MRTDAPSTATEGRESPFRVLIAGGGVAALEALLALRELGGPRIAPVLVAPDREFRYRPLSVTEPFRLGLRRTLDLEEIALENKATFMRDALDGLDPQTRRMTTTGGRRLEYDALLVAIGARRVDGVPGALTFRDAADDDAFRHVLTELEHGSVRRLAFAVPTSVSWPLGLYELALLTSARARELRLDDVKLIFATPEARPMQLFGTRASEAVRKLVDTAGIELRLNSKPVRFEDGVLLCDGGEALACDRVVALPTPDVAPISGLPQDPHGFVPVDRYGAVLGVERVYAAGDATWHPIKQGGLAAQQAVCAASAVAKLAGAAVTPQPFRPVLRGALLTGYGPRYLRAASGHATAAASRSILWWPPAKLAGRYLAPYLTSRAGYRVPKRPLVDVEPPVGHDAAAVDGTHADAVELALASADASARCREFRRALRWLEVAEDLELYLPREYELKRASWQELARTGGS